MIQVSEEGPIFTWKNVLLEKTSKQRKMKSFE